MKKATALWLMAAFWAVPVAGNWHFLATSPDNITKIIAVWGGLFSSALLGASLTLAAMETCAAIRKHKGRAAR